MSTLRNEHCCRFIQLDSFIPRCNIYSDKNQGCTGFVLLCSFSCRRPVQKSQVQGSISRTDLSLFWGLNLIQSDRWLNLSLFVKLAPVNNLDTAVFDAPILWNALPTFIQRPLLIPPREGLKHTFPSRDTLHGLHKYNPLFSVVHDPCVPRRKY